MRLRTADRAAIGTTLALTALAGCGNQPTEPRPLENKADNQRGPHHPADHTTRVAPRHVGRFRTLPLTERGGGYDEL